jgi:hypothetical protein
LKVPSSIVKTNNPHPCASILPVPLLPIHRTDIPRSFHFRTSAP